MPLISRERALQLPGGVPFKDPRTNLRFPGMEGTFDDQVKKIIRHRMANPKLYPTNEPRFVTFENVAQELEDYNCQRLGNSDQFCRNGAKTAKIYAEPVPNTPCVCGSMDAEAMYCRVCAGRRLVGFKCNKCGKERNK